MEEIEVETIYRLLQQTEYEKNMKGIIALFLYL